MALHLTTKTLFGFAEVGEPAQTLAIVNAVNSYIP